MKREWAIRVINETVIASLLVTLLVVLGFGNATVGVVTIGVMNVVDLPTLVD